MDSWKSEANLVMAKNDPTDYYTKMKAFLLRFVGTKFT